MMFPAATKAADVGAVRTSLPAATGQHLRGAIGDPGALGPDVADRKGPDAGERGALDGGLGGGAVRMAVSSVVWK